MIVCTRGSFESDQAKLAEALLKRNNPNFVMDLINNRIPHETRDTFLFELIGPDNRIVVQYAENKLISLGIIALNNPNHMGYYEYSYNWLKDNFCACYNFEIVKSFDGITDFKSCRELMARDNAEGFVVKFDNGLRVKLKYQDYCRLHKILTGISTKTIWEMLMHKDDFSIVLEKVPDEFMDWVKKTKLELEQKYKNLEEICMAWKLEVGGFKTRKEQAQYILNHTTEEAGVVFNMLDNKPYDMLIWKLVRPKYEQPFKKEIE